MVQGCQKRLTVPTQSAGSQALGDIGGETSSGDRRDLGTAVGAGGGRQHPVPGPHPIEPFSELMTVFVAMPPAMVQGCTTPLRGVTGTFPARG